MNNLNEAIKFIKGKLDYVPQAGLDIHDDDLEYILELLLKTKTDFRNVQHKAYRAERDED